MTVINILLFLYIVTKPFYFWASGLPQVSDIILLIAFVVAFFIYKPKEINATIRKNWQFFVFLIFVIIINLLYSIYYKDPSFDLRTAYYIFDAFGIILFSLAIDKRPKIANTLRIAFFIALSMQLGIFLLRLGRYYLGTRYMGTFNDPNQFSYFCLLSYCFIYLLDKKDNKLTLLNILFLLITFFLVFQSASTGMLLGVGVFIIFYLVSVMKNIIKKPKKYLPYLFVTFIVGSLSVCIAIVAPIGSTVLNRITNSKLLSRVEEKTSEASGNGKMTLWEERGYDRMLFYPQYLLYGAGEGQYTRYEKAFHQGELHATLPSILFCYGIIPLILIIKWFANKLKNQKLRTLCIYIALLLESFTLINSRQVLFWVIFALAPKLEDKNK